MTDRQTKLADKPVAADAPAVRRLSDIGGAQITGIDLAQPLRAVQKKAILAAFIDHHILIFPGQNLDDAAQLAFSREFGELEGHVRRLEPGVESPLVNLVTNLGADGTPTQKPATHGNYHWHTDKSYHAVPSLTTILHAIEIPPAGGDTQFANTGRAYDALPEARKRQIAGLRVVHSWESSRRHTGDAPATEEEKRERPPVTHPLVRIHPDTGARTLYIGSHASHVEGMDYDASRALLESLLEHTVQPQFVYTHRWRQGDLVMWDNRTLLHRALANYDMGAQRRVLHRTVVRGTVPF